MAPGSTRIPSDRNADTPMRARAAHVSGHLVQQLPRRLVDALGAVTAWEKAEFFRLTAITLYHKVHGVRRPNPPSHHEKNCPNRRRIVVHLFSSQRNVSARSHRFPVVRGIRSLDSARVVFGGHGIFRRTNALVGGRKVLLKTRPSMTSSGETKRFYYFGARGRAIRSHRRVCHSTMRHKPGT